MPQLKGSTVTADALHCLDETIRLVVEDKGGNFLVGVKSRAKLEEAITKKIEQACAEKVFKASQNNKGHGRLECRKIELVSIKPEETNYPHIKSVMRITRTRKHIRKGVIHKEESESSLYAATFSTEEKSALEALQLIRGHWSIENELHHTKDVSMNEDRYRARGGFARIMTAIKSCTTIMLRDVKMTAPVAMRRFATKTSLLIGFMKCKSLARFKLQFLG